MALRVKPCSHQDGKARYSGKGDNKAPSVASWRNNLTALSQYRNLLFIAYIDKIHIFKPQFPSQNLPTKPELIIDLPKSRLGLTGHIDRRYPHAVNHLIVGDVGREEILVACCDDGDVIGYTLHSIDRALRELERDKSHLELSGLDLNSAPTTIDRDTFPPLILENVGQSAWGLATHKAQRLIAVSSNSKEIYIFAFSLDISGPPQRDVERDSDQIYLKTADKDLLSDDRFWAKVSGSSSSDRSENVIIVLKFHETNIPNIAFYDSSHDGPETYLASIDIDGSSIVWEIWTGEAVINTDHYESSIKTGTRGWGIACIDPKASRMTEGREETFGCEYYTDYYRTLVDISKGARLIEDNSHWHPAFSKYGSVPGSVPVLAAVGAQQPEIHPEDADMDDADDMAVVDFDIDEDVLEESHTNENEGLTTTNGMMDDNDDGGGHGSDGDHSHSEGTESLLDETQLSTNSPTDLDSSDYGSNTACSNTPPGVTFVNFRLPSVPQENLSTVRSRNNRSINTLPFNLLQTTETDILLLREIAHISHGRPKSYSQVICRQAIHQVVPLALFQLQQIERLNMILQIPELSVVIVGNQVGRVGILTMTRWQAREIEGYKVECILPFLSEEKQGLRPETPLMGVAVGPVQGHERKPDGGSALESSETSATRLNVAVEASRRFRLMLVYCNQTVLSYELSRSTKDDEILIV